MLWPKHYYAVVSFETENDKIQSIVLSLPSVYNLRYKVPCINVILLTSERQCDLRGRPRNNKEG